MALEAGAPEPEVSESIGLSQQVDRYGVVEVAGSYLVPIIQRIMPNMSSQMKQSTSKKSQV